MALIETKKTFGLNALTLVTLMLVGSAILRVILGADGALAQSNPPNDSREIEQQFQSGTQTMPFSPSKERERLGRVLKALQEKEAHLNQIAQQQDARQQKLDEDAEKMQARLAEVTEAEQKLRATLTLSDSAAEDDLSRLTTVYESMKAKDAAALFEAMEPEFAAGFLGRMRADAAANIMAGLKPDFAYTISVILAGRNANAQKS